MIDGKGIYGFTLHYGMLFAFTLATLVLFLYLLRKKRLDIDEEPKYRVFDDEE